MKDTEIKYIYVWVDWESTGLWVAGEDGYGKNAQYERFNLPEDLVARFKYWERWHSDTYPEWDNERNKMDRQLYDAYGLSLTVDLKRHVGNAYRVFYNSPHYIDGKANYDDMVEIILVEREKSETELGKVVPMGVPFKK